MATNSKSLIGRKIRIYREVRNRTQLSVETEAGLASGMLSRIENGTVNPTKETIVQIGESLTLSNDELADLFGIRNTLQNNQQIFKLIPSSQNTQLNTLLNKLYLDLLTRIDKDLKIVLKQISITKEDWEDYSSNYFSKASEVVEKLISKKLISVLGVSYAVVWILDETNKNLKLSHLNVPSSVSKIIEGFMGKASSKIIYNISNPEHQKNYTVKTFLEGEFTQTKTLYDAGYPLINKTFASMLQTLLRVKYVLHVPLIANGKKMGVLGLVWNQTNFTEDNKKLINTFAEQISAIIYNTRLFTYIQNRVQECKRKKSEWSFNSTFVPVIDKNFLPRKFGNEKVIISSKELKQRIQYFKTI